MNYGANKRSGVYHKISTGPWRFSGEWIYLSRCGRDFCKNEMTDTRPKGKRICKSCSKFT